jgi:calmodulin
MLTHHKEVDAEKEMREAFKVFDRENKGEVATSELKAVLTTMGEKLDAEEVCIVIYSCDFLSFTL